MTNESSIKQNLKKKVKKNWNHGTTLNVFICFFFLFLSTVLNCIPLSSDPPLLRQCSKCSDYCFPPSTSLFDNTAFFLLIPVFALRHRWLLQFSLFWITFFFCLSLHHHCHQHNPLTFYQVLHHFLIYFVFSCSFLLFFFFFTFFLIFNYIFLQQTFVGGRIYDGFLL